MLEIAKTSHNSHPSTAFYEAFVLISNNTDTNTAAAVVVVVVVVVFVDIYAVTEKSSPKLKNLQQPRQQIERNVKKK